MTGAHDRLKCAELLASPQWSQWLAGSAYKEKWVMFKFLGMFTWAITPAEPYETANIKQLFKNANTNSNFQDLTYNQHPISQVFFHQLALGGDRFHSVIEHRWKSKPRKLLSYKEN